MRVLVFLGTLIGAACLIGAFFVSGAPQQAALAGMACAFAIIPYVIYRVQADDKAQDQRKEIIALLNSRQ